MTITINKRNVDALPFSNGKTVYHLDRNLEGFGIRVGKSTKSFYVEKRVNGKPKRITLGRFPVMSCEQARAEALKELALMAKGIDPSLEKRKQEEQNNHNLARSLAESITLEKALEDYLHTNNDLAEQTRKDYRKYLRLYLADWKDKRILDITETMVVEQHQRVTRTAKASGNSAFKSLRAVFNFAMDHYRLDAPNSAAGQQESIPLFTHNPVLILTKTKAWKKSKRRKTVIPRKKLGAWLRAVLNLKARTPLENKRTSCDYLLTLLLTGMREKECARLEWKDVNLDSGSLTLVEAHTKARRQHDIPFSDFLWSLMKDRFIARSSTYVFPSARSKEKPITWSRGVISEIVDEVGVPFCHHDLRRTFTSIAESIGIPNFTIKRLLNHALDADVTGGYISPFFDDDGLRQPIQRITDFILGEAGLKEQLHGSMMYLPVPSKEYRKLEMYSNEVGVSINDTVSLLTAQLENMHLIGSNALEL